MRPDSPRLTAHRPRVAYRFSGQNQPPSNGGTEAGELAMPISRNEDWVQITGLDEHDQIRFTKEFRSLMGSLLWEAKAPAGMTVKIRQAEGAAHEALHDSGTEGPRQGRFRC